METRRQQNMSSKETRQHERETDAVAVSKMSKTTAGATSIEDLSLIVRPGRFAGVIADTLASSRALLRILGGRLPVRRGAVKVLGLDPIRDRRALLPRVGWIPKTTAFPRGISLRDVARLSTDLGGGGDAFTFARICTALELDLGVRADGLRGATLQLASLALALQKSPDLLLIEDPIDPGDATHGRKLLQHAAALRARGTTAVITSERTDTILPFVDEIFLLRSGRIVEHITIDGSAEARKRLLELESLAPALPAPATVQILQNSAGPLEGGGSK